MKNKKPEHFAFKIFAIFGTSCHSVDLDKVYSVSASGYREAKAKAERLVAKLFPKADAFTVVEEISMHRLRRSVYAFGFH